MTATLHVLYSCLVLILLNKSLQLNILLLLVYGRVQELILYLIFKLLIWI
jgi:hypothetical protein